MFMSELDSIRVDHDVEEPVQVVHHVLVLQDGVHGPESRGSADPLPGMYTWVGGQVWQILYIQRH